MTKPTRRRKTGARKSRVSPALVVLAILVLAAIGAMALRSPEQKKPARATPPAATTPAPSVPVFGYEIVKTYPHDPGAFTQGLVWHHDALYEGTGQLGMSTLRRVDLETGSVQKKIDLPNDVFGEGIAIWKDSVIQITWQNQIGYVYDLETFQLRRSFSYRREGWGLTHDGQKLIMSDGSSTLTLRDPETFAETGRLPVTIEGMPLTRLNELEYIHDEIWANVWTTNQIVTIDPSSGQVTGVIDLTGLLSPADRGSGPIDVLNGIAWDRDNDRIFVTGKYWPKLYQIRLVEK